MGQSQVNPCWHMRNLVPQLADGSLKGFLRKYTLFHVQHCTKCQHALEALRSVISRLRGARTVEAAMPEDRWAAVEEAWISVEREQPPPG